MAALFVAVNGFAAFNWIPSSYQQFTWEAYAVWSTRDVDSHLHGHGHGHRDRDQHRHGDVDSHLDRYGHGHRDHDHHGHRDLYPHGHRDACARRWHLRRAEPMRSEFCVHGICCNTICDQPVQPAKPAPAPTPAPAPAVSHRTLLLIVVLLVAIGFFALTPLRFGKRR